MNFLRLRSSSTQNQTPALRAAPQLNETRTTPYMLTDLSAAHQRVRTFGSLLPAVGIFYAVKANSDKAIIRTIDADVQGYDVASLGELEYILGCGVSPDRIRYSNPVKVPHHIARAYELGVRYFAFDSATEITKIAEHAPGTNVYLRLKVSDYGSKFPLSKKFGVDANTGLTYCAAARDAGLNVCGVTFHVGSQSENTQVWRNAIDVAGRMIVQLQKQGCVIEFLDIGGGFPADYGDPVPTIDEIAGVVNESVAKYIPEGIEIIAEPGRFIVANGSSIVTSVIGRENRGGSEWLYLDMGTFQGLIEPLEMENLKYPVRTDRIGAGKSIPFVLSGPSCDAYDTIGSDYMLPADMTVGDKVLIDATGAYSLVYGSSFNGFRPPKVYHINDPAHM